MADENDPKQPDQPPVDPPEAEGVERDAELARAELETGKSPLTTDPDEAAAPVEAAIAPAEEMVEVEVEAAGVAEGFAPPEPLPPINAPEPEAPEARLAVAEQGDPTSTLASESFVEPAPPPEFSSDLARDEGQLPEPDPTILPQAPDPAPELSALAPADADVAAVEEPLLEEAEPHLQEETAAEEWTPPLAYAEASDVEEAVAETSDEVSVELHSEAADQEAEHSEIDLSSLVEQAPAAPEQTEPSVTAIEQSADPVSIESLDEPEHEPSLEVEAQDPATNDAGLVEAEVDAVFAEPYHEPAIAEAAEPLHEQEPAPMAHLVEPEPEPENQSEPLSTELVSFGEEKPDAELGAEQASALDHAADEAPEDSSALAQEQVSQIAAPEIEPHDLPPNYFEAAGDPEEPVEPPAGKLSQFQTFVVSQLSAFAAAARNFGGGMWRGVRDIKHPRNVREVAVWGGWTAAAFTTLLVGFFVFVTWGMPSTDDLWQARSGQSITFVDRNGNVILREGAQNAPPVDLGSLPPYVAEAFVAIEDRRFHKHWGIDVEGIMRAGAQNIRAGRVVQGGSTITQQLAKNLFLTNERSWRRKAQEIAMAVWLETKFTKEEILALYLSRVYFGAGAYGIEAAAERYFDRPARELTLLQSAMIAGLVKAPSRLNPASQDIASARTRAELVLQEMVSLNFISDAERQAALSEELVISQRNPAGVLSYFRDWIDPLLNDVIGTQRDDFIIETTIDIQSQRAGAEAVEAVLAAQGESRRASQAALLSMDDAGGVLAMVGGRDYDQSQFNRATQARRQPGSSFKYFIYLAAMEGGLTPWSVRNDAPITIRIEGQPDWTPGNYHEEFNGPVELARAFSQSYNMVAIRVANEVGGQHVIDVARRLGVASQLHNYHSLALGAQEVTLLELTQAYGAMASQGYRVEAHGVSRIRRTHDDEIVWSWRQTGGRQRVVEERPLRYMNYMMNRVVESGTGTMARMSGRQIGGKTGTANDYRDAWFIGFTPGIVTGVWVGNDDHRIAMARVTGGQLPADIWARFMPTALRNVPVRELQMPGPDDYEVGRPDPISPTLTAVGAPLGSTPPGARPSDAEDRSLDFGPEG